MEPATLLTAAAILTTIAGGVITTIRKSDISYMEAVRTDVDKKLDKAEYELDQMRWDRQRDQDRADIRDDISRIESKLDRLIDMGLQQK